MSTLGQAVAMTLAFKIGVGQIIQGDRFTKREEVTFFLVQVMLNGWLVFEQEVGYRIHPVQVNLFKVKAD